MTDAHCHVSGGDPAIRELIAYEPDAVPATARGVFFAGIHPWTVLARLERPETLAASLGVLEERLAADAAVGVGEIGLDRMKTRELPVLMHEIFRCQLRLAGKYARPTVLHGAKCWGQVVKAVQALPAAERPPAFIFHGFSRSAGLIPDIVRLNGYLSIGPSILNDHAVNYREMAKKAPLDRLLVETDRTDPEVPGPGIAAVLGKLAEIRGMTAAELEEITDRNADAAIGAKKEPC